MRSDSARYPRCMPRAIYCVWLLRVLLGMQLLLGLGLPAHAHLHAGAEVAGAAVHAPQPTEDEHSDGQTCVDCPLCRLCASPGLLAWPCVCVEASGAGVAPSPRVPGLPCASLRIDPYASRDPPF